MLLKEIIQNHQNHHEAGSLKSNLGDGYLLKYNPVFSSVRKAALKEGYRFTGKRVGHYEVISLTQLPKILKEKKIPYLDNVSPLYEIENQLPEYFDWQEIPPLKENYLLHESAHAVAYAFFKRQFRNKKPKTEKEQTLQILSQEAFANACESVANIFSTSRLHDEFLYKNSYIMEKGKSRVVLRAAYERFGMKIVFQFAFVSFLYANYLKSRHAMKDFQRVKKLVLSNLKTSKKEEKLLKNLFQVGFDLDPAFTISTNQFCLKLLGIKGDFYELLELDALKYFEQDKRYQKVWLDLARVISESPK